MKKNNELVPINFNNKEIEFVTAMLKLIKTKIK